MNTTKNNKITTFQEFATNASYSFTDTLSKNPDAKEIGIDYYPREVKSGHYVSVKPTPIPEPIYIIHSKKFFNQLGIDDSLATSTDFMEMFSADTSNLPEPLQRNGWATGYALSIYGTEYYDQCPFRTGNGYGDGRAVSIFEGVFNKQRYEMQLKGGGKTPYCRGADGRAVLRSSIREFLAQEHMDALGIATSRSLTLYTSNKEKVQRPWFNNHSYSKDPEVMISEPVAITTRVASSFLRVGQLELFARRVRKNEHPNAIKELEQLVLHIIKREYKESIDTSLPFQKQILELAKEFQKRLCDLVANWIRVGYCQGNFNSDNCTIGGFTLDYGPFGFMDMFDTKYQPWTGGGTHFSFLNQPNAAQKNYQMFCLSLSQLLDESHTQELENIFYDFTQTMNNKLDTMWANKLGLKHFDEKLFNTLLSLFIQTGVDYTIFFRELSHIPKSIEPLKKSFYSENVDDTILQEWTKWLNSWQEKIKDTEKEKLSYTMKQINPKYTLREWFLVPAYKEAQNGNYDLLHELNEVMTHPYNEQSIEIEEKYYQKKPIELFDRAGISHVSCSS